MSTLFVRRNDENTGGSDGTSLLSGELFSQSWYKNGNIDGREHVQVSALAVRWHAGSKIIQTQ